MYQDITSLNDGPEQTGLSLFCQIEKALQMESSSDDEEIEINRTNHIDQDSEKEKENTQNTSYLAEDFPHLFKFDSKYEKAESSQKEEKIPAKVSAQEKIQKKLQMIKMQQNEIDKQKEWVINQLKVIETFEKNQANYKEKYEKLQKKYNEEKQKWNQEKISLVSQLTELENRLQLQTTTKSSQEKITLLESHQRQSNANILSNSISEMMNSSVLNPKDSKQSFNQRKASPSQSNPMKNARSKKKSPQKLSPEKSTHHRVSKGNEIPSFLSRVPKERTRISYSQSKEEEEIHKSASSPKYFHQVNRKTLYTIPVDEKYLNFQFSLPAVVSEEEKKDGRKILYFKDGSKATKYRNNTIKCKHGQSMYYFFPNGDIGQEFHDGFKSYKYSTTKTIEITSHGQAKVLVFANGQREKHCADGKKYVQYPNGQYEIIEENGDYTMYYTDGKVEKKIDGNIITTNE